MSVVVTPAEASAPVTAYAARLAKDIFAHSTGAPLPPGSLDKLNVVIANPNVPLQLGVDEVGGCYTTGTNTHTKAIFKYLHP